MKIFTVIVTYYDDLWSDPDAMYVDSVFSTEDRAEKRAAEIKANYSDDCHVIIRSLPLDTDDNKIIEENRIRIR